mmetsp:Transcript_23402/g.39704  ORF Transcript_23402/g.39704 Transcript_23402/m.39704 type:complete len:248 (-) Transcript_23402:157-900(-)
MDAGGPLCALCFHHLVRPVRMFEHPRMTDVPICGLCFDKEEGIEFDEENDDLCFMCGEGDCGEIILCDCCEKGFCSQCIESFLGNTALQTILSTDPWSCFVCDPSALAEVTAQFNAYQQDMNYFPEDKNITRKLLLDVENEIYRWEMSLQEISEMTLRGIREELTDENLAQEEYANAQENWNHNIDLLHHRSAELQEHYEDQGEDIGVFFEILGKNRDENSANVNRTPRGDDMDMDGGDDDDDDDRC